MNIEIVRRWSAPDNSEYRATTTGIVSLDELQACFSLERTEMMVPEGVYAVKLAWSDRFQRMTPHLDVPMRTFIEIHGGNVATDSDGCILVADKRIDDYRIYEAAPATTAIEEALAAAEANREQSTVTVRSEVTA